MELTLGSDEGGFVVEGLVPALAERPAIADNTMLRWWPDADPGLTGLLVSTGSQWGPFSIEVTTLKEAPGAADQRWEDVVELSVTSGTEVVLAEVVDGPVGSLFVRPGSYRMRLGARGRSESHSRDQSADDEDSEEPLEHYLLELWPAEPAAAEIVRQESRFARDLLDPREVTPHPEDGVAASHAIARDVRRRPGAREVPGDLADLSLDIDLPGTPVRLFNRVRYTYAWPLCMGMSGTISEVGRTAYFDATLTELGEEWDDAGCLRVTLLELVKPKRVVLRWNWIPESEGFIDQRPALLEADSTITMTITRLPGPKEDPRCTVHLEHRGVPAAWVDDLRTLWTWHLEVRAAH